MSINTIHAVLTGATGGIGQAFAQRLNEQGAKLTLVGRNESKLSALVTELGVQHDYLVADLDSEAGCEALTTKIAETESVNLLIHSAGVAGFGQITAQTASQIKSTVSLNLTIPMLVDAQVIEHLMRRENSQIIHVGSAFGSIGFPGFSSYCASKFGLRGYSEALSREYSPDEVAIKYFAPRATKTGFNSSAVDNLNSALGNAVDTPESVAIQFIQFLVSGKKRMTVGWPEKLFCRINGALPGLVDKSLEKQRKVVVGYAKQNTMKEVTQ